jgi:hypothetical protein
VNASNTKILGNPFRMMNLLENISGNERLKLNENEEECP